MPDVTELTERTEILMPQLGETVTEGTVLQWFKAVGDEVAEDEELFEVSTDKVDTTVPSSVRGVLTEILVAEGETVPIGAPLAVIAGAEASASGPAPAPVATPRPTEPPPAPAARTALDRSLAVPRTGGQVGGGQAFLSPAVRRLLEEHHLDPLSIAGTGAGGRITREDVRRAADGDGTRAEDAAPVAPKAPAPAPEGPRAAPASSEGLPGDERIAFSSLRRRIAEHMTRSLHTAAHTLVVMEVDYHAVAEVRDARKADFRASEGAPLTYLPFIARAVVQAVADFPLVNASVDGDDLVVHREINLGVAVDLDFEGLIVPVVKGAGARDLRSLALAVHDQAERARAHALTGDDVSQGTFTITNAGGYGTLLTAPIINQPQVAILSTDGVRMKPVAVALADGTWGVAVHPVGNLALSFDHRAFDGAYASAFLRRVVEVLEGGDWAGEVVA